MLSDEMKATIKRAQEHHDAYWNCPNLEDEAQQYGTLGPKSIAHIGALLKVIDQQQAALDAANAENGNLKTLNNMYFADLNKARSDMTILYRDLQLLTDGQYPAQKQK